MPDALTDATRGDPREAVSARAASARDDPAEIRFDRFVYRPADDELVDAGGRRIVLRSKVLAVLRVLVRNVDRPVTKDALIESVWPDVVVTEDSLVQCVAALRRALGDRDRRIVQTLPKRGYRLVAGAVETPDGSSADGFSQQVRFVDAHDDARVAWARSGAGPTALVRTPHWMTHVDWDWRSPVYGETLRRWSRGRVLVRYDGRGCGLSDRHAPVGTLDDEVADLEAVVGAAGLDRFALVGRSQGGPIAIRYAAKHPDRVSHLVLIGAFARGSLMRGGDKDAYAAVVEQSSLLHEAWGRDNPAFHKLITSFMFPGATSEQVASFNHLQRMAVSPDGLVAIFRAICLYDVSEDLPRVRCPALVLHSPDDAIVPFSEGRLLAARLPAARLQTFDSPNHTPLPGEPAWEATMDAIDAFLDAPDPSPRDRGWYRFPSSPEA